MSDKDWTYFTLKDGSKVKISKRDKKRSKGTRGEY